MPRLKDAHFYPKVPRDVSEATKLGGIISIIAVTTILWLVAEEYSSYSTVKHTTKMGLDTTTMPMPRGDAAFSNIRININITMHRLPCQYASLEVADHVGSHQVGGVRNVHKVRVDKDGKSLGMYTAHKYLDKKNVDEMHMSDHVFPWHKQEHTQGDATHRKEARRAGLSKTQARDLGATSQCGISARHLGATSRRILAGGCRR